MRRKKEKLRDTERNREKWKGTERKREKRRETESRTDKHSLVTASLSLPPLPPTQGGREGQQPKPL